MTFFVRDSFHNLFLQKLVDKQSPPAIFHFIGSNSVSDKNQKTKKERQKYMSHKIEKPHDMVLSTQGTEWHKLATHLPTIGDMEVAPMLFDIVESPAFVTIDGVQTQLEDYKVLVADHRKVRSDLSGSDALVPLHIPKSGYRVISNREIWNVMKQSLQDLDCKVTSVCTLERGKKFAISCDIGNSDLVINKDKFKANLNFVTSHDGTIAMESFDSMIRIVCMNTFQWSREAADNVLKVYHTKNAEFALEGLGDLLNAILKGRIELAQVMEYLASHHCDSNDALAMAAGYFCLTTDAKENKLSTRSMNAAREIARLAANGIGNAGRSLYDLVNGATEYCTSGEGVGRKASVASQVYRSQLGGAAEHKRRFIGMVASDETRDKMQSRGREAVRQAVLAN